MLIFFLQNRKNVMVTKLIKIIGGNIVLFLLTLLLKYGNESVRREVSRRLGPYRWCNGAFVPNARSF